MARNKDFDAFFAEMDREPVKLKIFGKEHALLPALPAATILKLVNLHRKNDKMTNVPFADLIDMGVSIFGEELVNEWCTNGLDIDQLGELIKWAFEVYTGKTEVSEVGKNEGKPQTQVEE